MADVAVTLPEGSNPEHYLLFKGKSTAESGQFAGPDGHAGDFLIPAEWHLATVQVQLPATSAATATVRAYLTDDDTDDQGTVEDLGTVAGGSSAVTKTFTVKRFRRIKVSWTGNTGSKTVIAYFCLYRK